MEIRTVGDPVLRQVAAEITDVDDRLVRLTEQMFVTMYEAPGIGLAAPQIGVQQRLFVYDLGDGEQHVLVNPEIVESEGEWLYEEGCLSIPGLSFEIVRPKIVHLRGRDLDGNEVELEADELLARLFQHELDHLNGVLMLDHLEEDDRKWAMKQLRERELARSMQQRPAPAAGTGGLQLP
ncbi:MAG: peptide deformylase [Actinomycetota bacterium]